MVTRPGNGPRTALAMVRSALPPTQPRKPHNALWTGLVDGIRPLIQVLGTSGLRAAPARCVSLSV